jgi:hypothetical protein
MNKYLRFIFGLRRYFKSGLTTGQALEQARALLKKRISSRNENFLNLVERGVFGYPKSPYLKLLGPKKIVFADLKKEVENNGIEATLALLQKEGIYFTVDEFKGKTEVVRENIRFRCTEKMFDNPFLSTAYEVRSGATRSAGTRIRIDFDYLTQRSLYDAFLLDIHGVLTAPIANWFPLFPGAPGINSSLRFSHIGNPPKKWFSQVEKAQVKVNWEKRLGTDVIFFMGRLQGVPLAKPEYVNLNHALTIAQWANQMIKEHGKCVVYTFATSAVRVCMAAQENNLNIAGTRFLVTGEPLTAQKKKEIEAAGAIAIPVYGISEAGVIAAGGGGTYPESDHCYIYKDTTAILSHKHHVEHSDITVDSFLFTTILYESPKLLLNVGMGDYGTIYTKPDKSAFGSIGFDTHIANIRSYEKLTGEGVTFVDTDFINIIEKKLPERFGGQSTDYQLVEEEDQKGLNRLKLLVSPRLTSIDEKAVSEAFIKLLKNSEDSPESWAQSGTEMWNQARTVRVVREYPLPTRSGKILPFHIEKKNGKGIMPREY